MARLGLTVCALLLSTQVAQAQWLHTTNQDAFDEKTTQMAFAPSGLYALGFTCVGKDKSQIVLLTPEAYEKSMSMAGLLGSKLLIRVDSLPVRKLDVEFDDVSGKLRAVAIGADAASAAKEMAGAKQRIAAAIEIAGEKFHSNNFGVANSRSAIGKSLKGCTID